MHAGVYLITIYHFERFSVRTDATPAFSHLQSEFFLLRPQDDKSTIQHEKVYDFMVARSGTETSERSSMISCSG